MNKNLFLKLSAALVLTLPAHAVTGCTNSTLTGTYALQYSGSVTPALTGGVGGAVLPDAVQRRMSAADPQSRHATVVLTRLFLDGAGNVFGNTTTMVDGVESQGPVVGSYAVNDDCSVTLGLTEWSGGQQSFSGVVGSQGDQGMFLQTDQAVGVSGGLKR